MKLHELLTHYHWWGKLIGGAFGFLMAGPAGALFGILIGNFFDRGLSQHINRPYWQYDKNSRSHAQQVFFEATFSVMGYIAKADGRVSEEDIRMATRIMDEMRLRHEQKVKARQCFNQGKMPHFDLLGVLNRLEQGCVARPDLLKLFMDIQYRAAKAAHFSLGKQRALDAVWRRLGFAPMHQQYRFYEDFGFRGTSSQESSASSSYSKSPHYRARNHLAEAYAMLDINESATKQEVKRAYRRLISRNHPDKLIAQGASEQRIKMANEKTQKICKAYELICESKGW